MVLNRSSDALTYSEGVEGVFHLRYMLLHSKYHCGTPVYSDYGTGVSEGLRDYIGNDSNRNECRMLWS